MAAAALFTCLAVVAYVLAGYPSVIWAWSRLAPRAVRKGGGATPSVSIVLASRGEPLAEKLADCRMLDYPAEKLEVVVVLDGGGEDAAAAVRRLGAAAGLRVRSLASSGPRGKATALNLALGAATGEVVVFCDVRQRLCPGAIRELVANLGDPTVGAVTGVLALVGEDGLPAKGGLGLYARYETALRRWESAVHSTLGATGALYAVRRSAMAPLPQETILDDVLVPMRVVLGGLRSVLEPAAVAYDRACSPEDEVRRKVRTLAGNFQLLGMMPDLLRPGANPVFFQFVSHKLGRLLLPHALVGLFLANLLLAEGPYLALLAGQVAFYSLALAVGLARAALPGRRRISRLEALVSLPYTFTVLNVAALVALYAHLSHARPDELWRPRELPARQPAVAAGARR